MGAIRPIRAKKVMGGLLALFLMMAVVGCNGGAHPPSLDGDQLVWYVSTTGNDSTNTCHTPDSPCRTISWAVYYAHNEAVIHIADGIYDEAINILQQVVILEGNGPNTILTNTSAQTNGGVINIRCPSCQATADIMNLTIQNGTATKGGAVYAEDAVLVMIDVTVRNSSAEKGGGVYIGNNSYASLDYVTIEHCTSTGQGPEDGGGGIYNTGTLHLSNSTLRNNTAVGYGGGLYSLGVATLEGGSIEANTAAKGGGIFQTYGSLPTHMTATGISIMGNEAVTGAGVANAFTDDEGVVAGLGYLQMDQSTISYNRADATGGGLYNEKRASFFLTNVTISNNEAGDGGGGMDTGQENAYGLALNVTIAYNTAPYGAGITAGGGEVDLQNVLLASNTNENCRTTYGGSISSRAGNLSDDNTCNLHGPLDQNNIDAKIGLLTNNGGSTYTVALNLDSPAIDTAVGFLAPQIDQRYASRGLDGNGDGISGFDIGAYEVASVIASGEIEISLQTATPGRGIFTFLEAGDCHSEPDADSPVVTSPAVGVAAQVEGRNMDATWYSIQLPGFLCWVPARIGLFDADPNVVPVREVITEIATITPTAVPSGTTSFGLPELSTHAFQYKRDCVPDPAEVNIKVPLSQGGQGISVYLFYRLRNLASGTLAEWNDGLEMEDLGNGVYGITLSWNDIPEVPGLTGAIAEFRYQFVATDASGAAFARSPVYTDVTLSPCQ